jgi:hypothetical protein
MSNLELDWLTWHWVIGFLITVMCLISVGIIFVSVRAIGDGRMQDLMHERGYSELVLFAAVVFGTTIAIGLLWSFQ